MGQRSRQFGESRLALLPTERSGELAVAGENAVKAYSLPAL